MASNLNKIGFIGLGNVGGKLAGSLLRNGFDVTVRDLNPELVDSFKARGAASAASPKDIMESCDVVITCLPSPAASAAVMEDKDGLLEGVTAGKIWMEMSTTDEAEIKRLRIDPEGHDQLSGHREPSDLLRSTCDHESRWA